MILNNLKHFFKLVRWFHELLAILPFAALYFIIAYYVQRSGQSCGLSGINFLILCVCVQLLIAAGCIHNDIMDRKIDEINKPTTHIVGRAISLANAKKLFIAATLLVIIFSVYISAYLFREWTLICITVYMLSILYNVCLKRSPLFGNIAIACLASFIPLVILFFAKDCIAFLHNEKLNLLVYLYAAFPFLIIIPRELSLDISDLEGDKAGGCRTLPIVIGAERSKLVVVLFILLEIVLSVLLVCRYTYLMIPFLLVNVMLIYYIRLLKRCILRIDYIKAGRFLWFVMIAGLIGFAIATIATA